MGETVYRGTFFHVQGYGFMKAVVQRDTGASHPDVFVRARTVKGAFQGGVSPREYDGRPFYFAIRASETHPGKHEAYHLRDALDWHYPL